MQPDTYNEDGVSMAELLADVKHFEAVIAHYYSLSKEEQKIEDSRDDDLPAHERFDIYGVETSLYVTRLEILNFKAV